jgi:hypothetical protein
MVKMLSESDAADRDKNVTPEIVIIQDILLSGLRRAHEARMDRLEEQLANLVKDVDGKLSALAARIEAIADQSAQSQKQALSEIAEAISKVAAGLRPHAGAAENAGS